MTFSVRQSKSKEETVIWLNKDKRVSKLNWWNLFLSWEAHLQYSFLAGLPPALYSRPPPLHSHIRMVVTPRANRGSMNENPANASLQLQLCCCQLRREQAEASATAPLRLPKPSPFPTVRRQPERMLLSVLQGTQGWQRRIARNH